MSTQEYIKSITEMTPDDFPTLTPLPEISSNSISASNSISSSNNSFFTNISWQSIIIIILILSLLGINIFTYLAKGTEETTTLFNKIISPILMFFGYSTLETTKQTIETTATGTKTGVDIVAGATTGTINLIEDITKNNGSSSNYNSIPNTSNIPQGQSAKSSLPIQKQHNDIDEWQQGSLEKALEDSSQNYNKGPLPSDSSSSLQTTGKAGWCFIGEEHGNRTCSEIGINDMCMSGNVFPTQSICMNPNLRV